MQPQLLHDFSRIAVHPSPALTIQPKLSVNTPGDEYEQDADEVAVKIMRMPGSVPVQVKTPTVNIIHRKCPACDKEDMEDEKENEEELHWRVDLKMLLVIRRMWL